MKNNVFFVPITRHIFIIFALFVLTQHIKAQTNLINGTGVTPAQLAGEQLLRYNKLVTNYGSSNVSLIQMGDLATSQSNGRIHVITPYPYLESVIFKVKNIEYNSATNYYWYGEVDQNQPNETRTGSLMLQCLNGEKFGQMALDQKFYALEDLTNGVQAWIKTADDNTEHGDCAVTPGMVLPPSGEDVTERSGNCDIRLLVFYTDSALASIPTIVQRITGAVAETNQAFRNSGYGKSAINLVLVGIENLSGFSEKDVSFETIINTFSSNTMARNRQNALGADLICLYVNGRITLDKIGGIAFVGPGGANSGASVINSRWSPGPGFVMAHEIGHNLGMQHEFCTAEDPGSNCTPPGGFNHAHTWTNKNKKSKTILYSSGANNNEVIQYFSNPNIKFDGQPTGIVNSRHNALIIQNNACRVANYRNTFHGMLSVGIVGADFGCVGAAEAYQAAVSGPPGPYTYDWRISTDGGITFSNTSISNLDNCVVSFPDQVGTVVVLALTVTAGGQSAGTTKTIQVGDNNNGILCARNSKQNENNSSVIIAPNPTTGVVYVDIPNSQAGRVQIDLISQQGALIRNLYEGIQERDSRLYRSFLLDGLPQGSYFIRVTTPIEVRVAKLLFLK